MVAPRVAPPMTQPLSTPASTPPGPRWARELAVELGVLLAFGLFMGLIGPYGTALGRLGLRLTYWEAGVVGGGLIGLAVDAVLARRRRLAFWPRLLVVSALMSPLVTVWVLWLGRVLFGGYFGPQGYLALLPQVFFVCVPVTATRLLVRRPSREVLRTEVLERTVVAPPLPEAEAAFRRRLSARRREARLIAVQADDHYLRVHTDAGEEMVTLRFTDALAELERAHGFRTHRSWWVAADAVEAVSWRRGVGEARLAGGLVAPVSRTYAPAVKAAGWF